MNNAQELGAPPIPYGPHAVEEAIAASRRLAGSLARRTRRLVRATAAAGALYGTARPAQAWLER